MKRNIAITRARTDAAARNPDERNKQVTIKNCAPLTDYISKINNTQVNNAKDLDVLLLMYNLIEYSDNYGKTSRSKWEYNIDDLDDNITYSESLKSKLSVT